MIRLGQLVCCCFVYCYWSEERTTWCWLHLQKFLQMWNVTVNLFGSSCTGVHQCAVVVSRCQQDDEPVPHTAHQEQVRFCEPSQVSRDSIQVWHRKFYACFPYLDFKHYVHNVLLILSIKLQIHRTGASSCPIWRPLQGGRSWVHHLRHCHWAHYQTIVKRNHWDPCYRGGPC